MSSSENGIVIVGGGLAAARTAEQLRKSEYTGPVTIVSDEVHLPYDRPPLSKDVLHADLDDVTLKPAEFYTDNNITLRLGSAAQTLDTSAKTVTLADGSVLGYDELVIATGLVPKRIPSFPDLEGIRVLRNLDEALALRTHAASARKAVIIGAGFIGCEVAASLRKLGVDVVLVEPQPAPLASVLGEQVGSLVTRLHRAEGVDVRAGVGVTEVRGDSGHVSTVVLSDGSELPADLVVVGIGSRPATEWLDGSGVAVDNGVVCDEAGPYQRAARVGAGRCGVLARCHRTPSAGGALEQRRRAGARGGALDPGQGSSRARRGALLLERPVRREDPVPRRAGGQRRRAHRRGRRAQVPGLLRA